MKLTDKVFKQLYDNNLITITTYEEVIDALEILEFENHKHMLVELNKSGNVQEYMNRKNNVLKYLEINFNNELEDVPVGELYDKYVTDCTKICKIPVTKEYFGRIIKHDLGFQSKVYSVGGDSIRYYVKKV